MIYYFSGTGNSEWVAKEIAKNIADYAINIIDIIKSGKGNITITKNDSIGLVFPIYAWAAPEVVKLFIEKVKLEDGAFSFAVCTCVEEAGLALKKLSKYIKLDSSYSIFMPNNYIIGSDVDTSEVANKKIQDAKKQIEKISLEIKSKKSNYQVSNGKMPFIKSNLIAPAFNKYARDIKPFWVEDTCIGCGLCERKCPTDCISLKDNKPVWNGKCYQCLSCINRCPKQAIQYGNKTKKRSRYYFT